ncbi:hypothetical protein K431DRAFT_68730 [Polychaeton citri CBS 116435]|uniref:RNA helicase n=1 Tax=Polychaeton citri CBS 116435 TaxID=1314669 RepID=A0A9P4UQJ3_9PEZI|nr:hypothetical protein K431DRAFT_68730 [Polychaeton citri CBS 116435]
MFSSSARPTSASAQYGSTCIRCIYRARVASLESRRWKASSSQKAGGQRSPRSRFGKPGGLSGRFKLDFGNQLQTRLKLIKAELKSAPILDYLRKEDQITLQQWKESGKQNEKGAEQESSDLPSTKFSDVWSDFLRKIESPDKDNKSKGRIPNPFGAEVADGGEIDTRKQVLRDLRKAYDLRGSAGLDDRIKYHFYAQITNSRFSTSDLRNQKLLADLRYPGEWYPATRQMHRQIHMHVGPTNSGKTYQALQRLEKAKRSVYAGPLRLLAHEVYSRMTAKGLKCQLITGEERRIPEDVDTDHYMSACTVEMVPLNTVLDVAVIDEIQMIGNKERGWAWTQALLGIRASELHLCGEERTVPLIKEICASLGEEVHIHRYDRLSPLAVADKPLNKDLKQLRKGDCIVSFSVLSIHALRRDIEAATGKNVAIVYGSLPPETRAQQARLFNDPDNDYDFLVASDAVGMGLNLAIKRIVFESSMKSDGYKQRTLAVADIKQIGGRAGRYRVAPSANEMASPLSSSTAAADHESIKSLAVAGQSAEPDLAATVDTATNAEALGLVTTLEKADFPVIAAAMGSDPEPLTSAGLFAPSHVLDRFSSYFPPGTPFSYIMTRLHEISQMHKRFHLCDLRDQTWIADQIESVTGLTVADRYIICAAPASRREKEMWHKLLPAFAKSIAEQQGGGLLDIEGLDLEIVDTTPVPTREYLRKLEELHKALVVYLWLSYRFAGVFHTRALAFHVKEMVEKQIEETLRQSSSRLRQWQEKLARQRERSRKSQESLIADDHGNVINASTGEVVRGLVDRPTTDGNRLDAAGEEPGVNRESAPEEMTEEERLARSLLEGYHDLPDEEGHTASQDFLSSFSAWRARQTRGESQGLNDAEFDEHLANLQRQRSHDSTTPHV